MEDWQIYLTIWVVSLIIIVICKYKIFQKAGLPWRWAFVPIYSDYLWFKLAWKPKRIRSIFFPPAFIIFKIISIFHVAKKFGKKNFFAFGFYIFPLLFLIILWFWKSKYDTWKKYTWKYYNRWGILVFTIISSVCWVLFYSLLKSWKYKKSASTNENLIKEVKTFADYFFHPVKWWMSEHDYYDDNPWTISRKELRPKLRKLKKWDILFTYTPSYSSSYIIPWEWTHALVYLWRWRIIDASSKWVLKRKLIEVSNLSRGSLLTWFAAFRPKFSREKFKMFMNFLEEKIWSSYDYWYTLDKDKFYCSWLVWLALDKLWFDIPNKIEANKILDTYEPIVAPQTLVDYLENIWVPKWDFEKVLVIRKEWFKND